MSQYCNSLRVIFSFIIVFGFACCETPKPTNYTLVSGSSGIVVERFDSINNDENRFNQDNKLFKVGTEFVYSYEYKNSIGESLLFSANGGKWKFTSINSPDSTTIKRIVLKVKSGLSPFIKTIPDYNQTIISYTFEPVPFYSLTGVIENDSNLWIHPPRQYLFEILELNPFPYVKFPLEVGKTWKWSLRVGKQWGDERWVTWDGNINNEMHYEIVDQYKKRTKFGNLKCFEILSTASNELGVSKLIIIFNEEYGFIEMNYVNIDGSKIQLELLEKNCSRL